MFRSIKALNHPWVLQLAAALSALLFFVVLMSTLIYPWPLGLADNHDYWRLMDPFGLTYPDASDGYYFQHISLTFLKGPLWHLEIISSGIAFVGIAYLLSIIFQLSYVPLVLLGAVHCLFYSVAFYFYIRNTGYKHLFPIVVTGLVALLFLTDIFFTAYFNSFYQESSVFIFLLFFIALFQSKKVHFWWEWLMVVGVAFSKVSNITFLLLFIPLAIKYWHRKGRSLKLIVTIMVCSVIFFIQSSNQNDSNSPNVFNSFFVGLAQDQHSEQLLHDFGLKYNDFSPFVGKNYWQAYDLADNLKAEFYQKVNHRKIVLYYLSHPIIVLEKLRQIGGELVSEPRPQNLANRSDEFSPDFVLEKNITSFWQKALPIILLPGLLLSLVQLFYLIKWRYYHDYTAQLLIVLPSFLPLQLAVSFIGDGWNEFAKHNSTFYFVFVLWLVLSGQFWYKQLEMKRL